MNRLWCWLGVRTLSRPILMLVLCATISAGLVSRSGADEIHAVLSSSLGPYTEALDGFQEAFGRKVGASMIGSEKVAFSPETRIVVAFGGKAAVMDYPDEMTLIYCLAPGSQPANGDQSSATKVSMLPRPLQVLQRLRQIQPGLNRLVVLWTSEGMKSYLDQMQIAAASLGMQVTIQRLGASEELPEKLREIMKLGGEAIWLPPDPLLITPANFGVLKAFCTSNSIPFYVPSEGLVEKGAVAAVSSSFREIGRTAAIAAHEALSGVKLSSTIYPELAELSINVTAAERCGLKINPLIIKQADKVYQ